MIINIILRLSKQITTAFYKQGTHWSVQMYLTLFKTAWGEGQSCVSRPQCAVQCCNSLWQANCFKSKHLSHCIIDWHKYTVACQEVTPLTPSQSPHVKRVTATATISPWKSGSKVESEDTKQYVFFIIDPGLHFQNHGSKHNYCFVGIYF